MATLTATTTQDGDGGGAAPSSADASPSSSSSRQHTDAAPKNTPSPLLTFPTISATAFLLGASTACIISLRRGRVAAAREKLEAESRRRVVLLQGGAALGEGSSSSSAGRPGAAAAAASASGGSTPLIGAASRGPFALFSELNAAAFQRSPSASSSSSPSSASRTPNIGFADSGHLPAALSAKARGKQAVRSTASLDSEGGGAQSPAAGPIKAPTQPEGSGRDMWSAFDAPSGAPPPSVLRRRKGDSAQSASSARQVKAMPPPPLHHHQSQHVQPEYHSRDEGGLFPLEAGYGEPHAPAAEGEAQAEGSVWTSPVGMAVGAFTIATALVGCTAFVGVQIAKSLIGFDTMDEFVQRMTELVPSRSRTSELLNLPQPASDLPLSATAHTAHEGDEELYQPWSDTDSSLPANSSPAVERAGPVDARSTLEESLARLERARTPAEWWGMVRDQLDAEREEDVRARVERVSSARGGQV
ncbi:hypothetical protein V8E36_007205 [Tilletia maclaganii]